MWHVLIPVVVGVGIGIALAAILNKFWDDISNWLNNTAADVVGQMLGINARKNMQRAVVTVSRIRDKLRNHGVIYTKKIQWTSILLKLNMKRKHLLIKRMKIFLMKLIQEGNLLIRFSMTRKYQNGKYTV